MKFFAQPNLFIRFKPLHKRLFNATGFFFDANGEFETDRELLIKVLQKQFKYEDTATAKAIKPENTADTGENIKHCKKCDFTCFNQGDLLAHYRKEHPKGDAE